MAKLSVIDEISRDTNDAPLPILTGFGSMKRSHKISWPSVSDKVEVSTDLFRILLRLALENVPFDEDYYLALYPDVMEALKEGSFTNARHHYIEFGYFEDRLPFHVEVDEAFYFWGVPRC